MSDIKPFWQMPHCWARGQNLGAYIYLAQTTTFKTFLWLLFQHQLRRLGVLPNDLVSGLFQQVHKTMVHMRKVTIEN